MKNTLLLHDLESKEREQYMPHIPPEVKVVSALPEPKHCVGCFGCWLKKPGQCVIQDKFSNNAAIMAQQEKIIIVSENVYGGFSPAIKTICDRSIGVSLPYFRILEGEMHHKLRYKSVADFEVYFYGSAITATQQEIAKNILQANATNLGVKKWKVHFLKVEELKEVVF